MIALILDEDEGGSIIKVKKNMNPKNNHQEEVILKNTMH